MPIGNQPPVTNKAAADKNKAANAIHMQGQFKAGAAPQDASSLQKLGAAFTGEQRSQDVQVAGAQAAKDITDIGREQKGSEIEQAEQNIKDQEQLNSAIEEQKTALIEMDIDITEDEFADEMTIQTLNEQQNFQNETQIEDLARLSVDSDEEFLDLAEESYKRTQEQLVEDEWELSVYNRLAEDSALREQIAADQELAAKIKIAQQQAEAKAKASRKKAAKNGKMVAVAKVAVGTGVAFIPGGQAAGVAMAVGGASDYATADQQA